MLSLKELRYRKKTTLSILRLTQAMKMIAQAKFYREKVALRDIKESRHLIQNLACRVLKYVEEQEIDLKNFGVFKDVDDITKPWVVILMTSNNGLCGIFNQSLIREAEKFCADHNGPIEMICFGKKGESAFEKHTHLLRSYDAHHPHLALQIVKDFKKKNIRGCTVISSHFYNILKQDSRAYRWLPLKIEAKTERRDPLVEEKKEIFLGFDPNVNTAFESILDQLLKSIFQNLSVEHVLCEHAARMAAMENACENSKKMAFDLQRELNRLRQALITKELSEIISGSENF